MALVTTQCLQEGSVAHRVSVVQLKFKFIRIKLPLRYFIIFWFGVWSELLGYLLCALSYLDTSQKRQTLKKRGVVHSPVAHSTPVK